MKNGKSMKRIMIKIGNMIAVALACVEPLFFRGSFYVRVDWCYNIRQRIL